VSSRCETAAPRFLVPSDPALTVGCVKGGEAINMVTSKTPFTQPIGKSDTAPNEVAGKLSGGGPHRQPRHRAHPERRSTAPPKCGPGSASDNGAPAWLNRMPAMVRQENLRPVATQASLILELEGIVAYAQCGGRSYRSPRRSDSRPMKLVTAARRFPGLASSARNAGKSACRPAART
jgi:hypothetical protein